MEILRDIELSELIFFSFQKEIIIALPVTLDWFRWSRKKLSRRVFWPWFFVKFLYIYIYSFFYTRVYLSCKQHEYANTFSKQKIWMNVFILFISNKKGTIKRCYTVEVELRSKISRILKLSFQTSRLINFHGGYRLHCTHAYTRISRIRYDRENIT